MNHHACLLRQTKRDIQSALAHYVIDENTEVVVLEYGTVAISDVRSLIATASRKPVALASMLLVVCFETINTEAEQALLKILEEPPETTKFLFVVPHSYRPLPTIASRVFELTSFREMSTKTNSAVFLDFLAATYKDRLELIAKNCGDKKDLVWLAQMKVGLVAYLEEVAVVTPVQTLTALAMILGHLDSRGASNKMLLEELALTLQST